MKDLLRKSILTGIGLVSLSRERAESLVQELIAKGRVTEKEGQALAEELLKKGSEARGDIKEVVESALDEALEKLHLVRRQEFDVLNAEMASLRQELNELKTNGGSSSS